MKLEPWIGVDFDGTLVKHAYPNVGDPIWPMINRIKQWIMEGKCVKIFTARVGPGENVRRNADMERIIIGNWCNSVGLPRLEVTATKDFLMKELWDDRAMQVEQNTGQRITDVSFDEGYSVGYKDGYEAGFYNGFEKGQINDNPNKP